MAPFTVLGTLLFAAAILTYAILPGCEYADLSSQGGLFKALRIPSVLLAAFSVLAAAISIGFLSATLEPHLRQVNTLLQRFSVFHSAQTQLQIFQDDINRRFSLFCIEWMNQFSLSPVVMGLMFVIEGGVYALTAPVWGYLCDRKLQPKVVTLIGSLLVFAGFLLVGPAPFIPMDT